MTKNLGLAIIFLFFQNLVFSQIKILFDATKAETAANADWTIDSDIYNVGFGGGNPSIGGSGTEANPQRFPSPAQSMVNASTTEGFWQGGLSAWGIECVKKGYQVETLPIGGKITYNDATNVQDLSNYKVFIVCEPNILFTTAEKNAMKNYVQNGGSLFILADHDGSDRNFDGYDSPAIWNDFMTTFSNPFGITFDLVDISQTSSNIPSLPSDPILNGTFGNVSKIKYSGGATMTLNPSKNSSVKGVAYTTGSAFGNTNAMFAYCTYGSGKVAAIGDSSPADDGTGDPNDVLYDGWLADASGNHRKLFMNATIWLATANVTPLSVTTTKQDVKCNGKNTGSAAVSATGGTGTYSYLWSNNTTTSSIANLVAGTYTVTITSGSASTTSSITITQPSAINTAMSSTQINCISNGSAQATVSGGTPSYTYLWSNGNNSSSISVSTPNTYKLTITDANSCTQISSVTITEDKIAPVISSISSVTVNCFTPNPTINVVAIGQNLTYLWNDGSKNNSLKVNKGGNYFVNVTNTINGCSELKYVTVPENLAFGNINVVTSNPSCGNYCAEITSANSNYSYLWSNGDTKSKTCLNNSSPKFDVTVTNTNNGCVNSPIVKVILPSPISVTIGAITNASNNQSNGAANVIVSGGTGQYTFEWIDSNNKIIATSQNLSNAAAGTYICKIKDEKGCTTSTSVQIKNTTTVFDIENIFNISISPNPATQFCQIQFNNGQKAKISISDIENRLMLENVVQNGDIIDVSTLANGLYFLKIEIEGKVFGKKLIIAK